MNFEGLKNRVDRAEALVEGRLIQTGDRYSALKSSWRQAWTPSRIVIAGLLFIPLTRLRGHAPAFVRGMLLIGALPPGPLEAAKLEALAGLDNPYFPGQPAVLDEVLTVRGGEADAHPDRAGVDDVHGDR